MQQGTSSAPSEPAAPDDGPPPPGSATAAPSATSTTPSGPTIVVERPPPGLAQGKYAVSPWVIGLGGVALVAAIAFFFWWRHRQHVRQNRFESVSPQSVPPPSSRR